MGMKWFDWVAFLLLVVGGINWGLIGLFEFNLVSWIFRFGWLVRSVYFLVGVSGVYALLLIPRLRRGR